MTLIESLNYQPVVVEFGTSGLRGLVKHLTDLECHINTLGFIEFLRSEENLKLNETFYIAGDLRYSSPHIMAVIAQSIKLAGYRVINLGLIPTPALAYYAFSKNSPSIMVTGSHIPSDRNGLKFYKRSGEVLKEEEAAIQKSVAKIRQSEYRTETASSRFDSKGMLKGPPKLPPASKVGEAAFVKRYADVFGASLKSKKVVVYQQSAVGRDILVAALKAAGASVVPVKRSDVFLPIDTENVTEQLKETFSSLSRNYPDAFAIVSADGDSDRPFVVDAEGTFHRGDVLGAIVADYLGVKFAALPISANDAVDQFCQSRGIKLVHTKVGSPMVISAMEEGAKQWQPAASWEVNGGFLTANDIRLNQQTLKALPTRDAFLPIFSCLAAAASRGQTIKELFAELPRRYTGGALIDDVPEDQIAKFRSLTNRQSVMESVANDLFKGKVKQINLMDGLRIYLTDGSVMHFRPSGNAPQFRIYTIASSQSQADLLAQAAIKEDGYIMQLLDLIKRLND